MKPLFGQELSSAVMEARGWNKAIKAASKIALTYVDKDWPGDDQSMQAKNIASEIAALDKSMQAC